MENGAREGPRVGSYAWSCANGRAYEVVVTDASVLSDGESWRTLGTHFGEEVTSPEVALERARARWGARLSGLKVAVLKHLPGSMIGATRAEMVLETVA